MKDETFTFIETVKERSDPARSAFKKGKHKGCMLPHENLTRKELNKMNGEVNTINLNKPMKWSEFKALDTDIQQRYIKRLRDLYNVSTDALAHMFGLYPNTVNKMFRIMGLADGKRHRMTWQQKSAFDAFCNGTKPDPVPEEKPVDDIPEETYTHEQARNDLLQRLSLPPTVPEKDADGQSGLRFRIEAPLAVPKMAFMNVAYEHVSSIDEMVALLKASGIQFDGLHTVTINIRKETD